MKSRIHTIEKADIPELAEVHVRSWQEAYPGIVPDDVLANRSVERRRRSWEITLARHDERGFLCRVDGRIVGFASIGTTRDRDLSREYGELMTLYVLKAHWGSGIADALIDAAKAAGRTMGLTATSLWVFKENVRARAFYTRHGFIPDGTQKPIDWGEDYEPTDEIRMLQREDAT